MCICIFMIMQFLSQWQIYWKYRQKKESGKSMDDAAAVSNKSMYPLAFASPRLMSYFLTTNYTDRHEFHELDYQN